MMNGQIRPTRYLAVGALMLAVALARPVSAQPVGSHPRADVATIQSLRPIGQSVVVRVTWGERQATSTSPGCAVFNLERAGVQAAPGALPSGLFAQVDEASLGLVQGLESGDQVDVHGVVGWATCASNLAVQMGWLALAPVRVVRVGRLGEAPPEPPSELGVSAGTAVGPPPVATAAPVPPRPPEPPGYDATVNLTDGNSIQGRVVEESIELVKVVVAGNTLTLERTGIASIVRAGAARPIPAASSQGAVAAPERRPPPRPSKPPRSAQQKARDEARAKAALKLGIGGGLMAPACAMLASGTVYLVGGIVWESDGSYGDLPIEYVASFRDGKWPLGPILLWSAGFPTLIVAIRLLDEGRQEAEALGPEPSASARGGKPLLVPWGGPTDGGAALGITGTF